MKLYGLIGYPLTHSFSKKYFTEKFEQDGLTQASYELFPIKNIGLLNELLEENPDLCGFNVTIPYKVTVLDFVDEVDPAAAYIGAVNTISVSKAQGKVKLKGYNTDAHGFRESLVPLLASHHQHALIFGDGGAAKAVKYVLEQLNIGYTSVLRNPKAGSIGYHDLNEQLFSNASILINTTPLGTYPNIDTCPDIPYEFIGVRHLAYDLVYNPEETKFLRLAAARGAKTKGGLEMLHLQAERAWQIWTA